MQVLQGTQQKEGRHCVLRGSVISSLLNSDLISARHGFLNRNLAVNLAVNGR